jgi:hypothetical protein
MIYYCWHGKSNLFTRKNHMLISISFDWILDRNSLDNSCEVAVDEDLVVTDDGWAVRFVEKRRHSIKQRLKMEVSSHRRPI